MITDHTLRVLEFPHVLAQFAARAQAEGGARRLRALTPLTEPPQVARAQSLYADALRVARSDGGFPSTAHDDLGPTLERLKPGSLLDPREFLAVARNLRVVRQLNEDILDHAVAGEPIRGLAEALVPSRELESRIGKTIGPGGDILDGASPKLGKLRRQSVATRDAVRKRLEGLRSTLGIRADGDNYITFRSGRYVIPVPAGDRGKVRGIVHDQSASGQTFFVEPFVAVDDNNALARCDAEISEEERRILAELSERVADAAPSLIANQDVLARLDACRAIANTAREMDMSFPDVVERGDRLELRQARHPILLAEAQSPDAVVPLDLELGGGTRMIMLTGPNMGGKTVALKTLGLSALMAMCGLPVPAAEGTTVPFLRTIAADIGDEQSLVERLSTFASHLKYLAEFLNDRSSPALILLDELGTGTDPDEGGALARATLEAMDDGHTYVVATTHLSQLKEFAAEHPSADNGSMAFDEAASRPTFRLEVGTPGRSRALDVARRLDFPREVLERAEGYLGAETRRMDELLAEVERARERVRDAEAASRRAVAEAESKLRQAEERERAAEDTVSRAKADAARESARMLEETQALVRETRKRLTAPDATTSEVEAQHRAIRERSREAARHRAPEPETKGSEYPVVSDLAPGRRVWSLDLAAEVVVESTPNRRGTVRVAKDGFRIEVPVDRLREAPPRADRPARRAPRGGVSTEMSSPDRPGSELDLRGQSAEEAVARLERYLDQSLLSGGGLVRIVHGKGTGVLRDHVARVLAEHFAVIDYRLGQAGEGGDGVTVAQLGDR